MEVPYNQVTQELEKGVEPSSGYRVKVPWEAIPSVPQEEHHNKREIPPNQAKNGTAARSLPPLP